MSGFVLWRTNEPWPSCATCRRIANLRGWENSGSPHHRALPLGAGAVMIDEVRAGKNFVDIFSGYDNPDFMDWIYALGAEVAWSASGVSIRPADSARHTLLLTPRRWPWPEGPHLLVKVSEATGASCDSTMAIARMGDIAWNGSRDSPCNIRSLNEPHWRRCRRHFHRPGSRRH
jgi:hypothetical protein